MNTKKILAFMLSLAIVCPIGSTPMAEFIPTITANAEDLTPTNESYFTFDANTGTITKYTGTDTDVVIPSTIGGVDVTSIGEWAFSYCTSLTSVTIPSSVTSIGDYAFSDCTALESVTIPDSITSIGEWAFSYCESLTSITIPDSVTSIGDSAFYNCTSLTSVTIPDSVTSIGGRAFDYCTSLTSVTIPNSVTSIGERAFQCCTALESITIPNSVTTIGISAFYYCTALESVTFNENSKLTSIGYEAFSDCTSLTSVTIPSNVNTIGDYAFQWCTALESITIPNSVTTIGISAFYYCTALESVTFNENSKLTSIGEGAFDSCESLTSITIPNSVTSIGEMAFVYCTALESIFVDKLQSECDGFSILTYGNSAMVYYAFALTNNLENITSSNTPENNRINSGKDYVTTLTADEGYTLPKDITIKVGDTTLTDGYTFEDGVLTILAENLTDNITIEATATLNEYTVTSNLTNITSNGAKVINHGEEYKATLTAKDGYTLPKDVTITVGDTTLTDGYTFVDGVLTIDAQKVTDDITIEATAKLNEYKVTSNLTNITSNGKTVANHGIEYKATLTAKDGYTLPESITVKVGNTTLTDGYTFVDGVLTIKAENITDDITIEATAEKVGETTEPIEPIQFTSSNLLKLKKHVLGISKIDDISSLDVNQDNQLNILDFLTIKNSILNQ